MVLMKNLYDEVDFDTLISKVIIIILSAYVIVPLFLIRSNNQVLPILT